MAHQPHAGTAGRDGGGRGQRGGRFPKQSEPGTLPHKGGEVGACNDLKGMGLPLDLATKEKMVTCYAAPRRSWHYMLAPTTEMMRVRSDSQRSNLCFRSPPILIQY